MQHVVWIVEDDLRGEVWMDRKAIQSSFVEATEIPVCLAGGTGEGGNTHSPLFFNLQGSVSRCLKQCERVCQTVCKCFTKLVIEIIKIMVLLRKCQNEREGPESNRSAILPLFFSWGSVRKRTLRRMKTIWCSVQKGGVTQVIEAIMPGCYDILRVYQILFELTAG